MSGYRFCRTDDVPPMSVEDFKRDKRERNLWSSSCMVACEDDEPIAVVLS